MFTNHEWKVNLTSSCNICEDTYKRICIYFSINIILWIIWATCNLPHKLVIKFFLSIWPAIKIASHVLWKLILSSASYNLKMDKQAHTTHCPSCEGLPPLVPLWLWKIFPLILNSNCLPPNGTHKNEGDNNPSRTEFNFYTICQTLNIWIIWFVSWAFLEKDLCILLQASTWSVFIASYFLHILLLCGICVSWMQTFTTINFFLKNFLPSVTDVARNHCRKILYYLLTEICFTFFHIL